MTLEQLLASKSGYWQNDHAMITGDNGYVRCVATRTGDKVALTDFGKTQVFEVADVSTSVVISTPKKRGRKPAQDAAPDSLDDLDI